MVCESELLSRRTRPCRVSGLVLLRGFQNRLLTAKDSAFSLARSLRRHRITLHHARLHHYLPPILFTLPPTHQSKPIGHACCSGLALYIFSSPARLAYASFPFTPTVAAPPS